MAIYNKSISVSGKWVKGSEVQNGTKAKLVAETVKKDSTYTNKDGSMKKQDVSKILFQGQKEPLNINLNRATINALVDAFGTESKDWINKTLTVATEKVMVQGKRVTAVYLVPDGYVMGEDANGYVVISKQGEKTEEDVPEINLDEEMGSENIPF